ncbi:hypothetical protein MNBD_GAMMA15-1070 [hydrothermal vent metagenome]|uniref:Copper chaperone PCu(A)C n=1 Tax=hydrothermal vent metagenome TaxID=652676 RepID=A0A3B0YNC5_9ZZZZ
MIRILLLTTFAILWTGMAQADENTAINHAWIREAPPGAPTLAGYLCLDNKGEAEVTLTGVSSPAFKRIMMHRTKTVDGMSRMLHQNKVIVPAGKQVCFEPGGLHLMISAPEHRLVAGDQVELILQFSKGPGKHIQVPIKAL